MPWLAQLIGTTTASKWGVTKCLGSSTAGFNSAVSEPSLLLSCWSPDAQERSLTSWRKCTANAAGTMSSSYPLTWKQMKWCQRRSWNRIQAKISRNHLLHNKRVRSSSWISQVTTILLWFSIRILRSLNHSQSLSWTACQTRRRWKGWWRRRTRKSHLDTNVPGRPSFPRKAMRSQAAFERQWLCLGACSIRWWDCQSGSDQQRVDVMCSFFRTPRTAEGQARNWTGSSVLAGSGVAILKLDVDGCGGFLRE